MEERSAFAKEFWSKTEAYHAKEKKKKKPLKKLAPPPMIEHNEAKQYLPPVPAFGGVWMLGPGQAIIGPLSEFRPLGP
eukprot:11807619-Alexandrium_andersonii.AAC.1